MNYDHTIFKSLDSVKIGEFANIFNRLYRRIDEENFQRVLTGKVIRASELHKQNQLHAIDLGCNLTLHYSANDTITAYYADSQTSIFPVERLIHFLKDLNSNQTASLLLDSNKGKLWVYFVYTEEPMFDSELPSYKIQLTSNKSIWKEEVIQSETFKKDLIKRIKRFLI